MITSSATAADASSPGCANGVPYLGFGIGLRNGIETGVADRRGDIDWLEVITEDFLFTPGRRDNVRELCRQFPIVPHGIELSIGSADGPDPAYVTALAEFVDLVDAPWFSDHIAFTRAGGVALNSLAPLLRTRQVADSVARTAQRVQEAVGVPFLLENISYVVDVPADLSEPEFITEIMERCDCGLLLDLTNVYNNSVNNNWHPVEFLDAIPLERVVQLHLAGGTWAQGILQDDHVADVHEPVWDLFTHVLARAPVKGVIIERDGTFPGDFDAMMTDLDKARLICAQARCRA